MPTCRSPWRRLPRGQRGRPRGLRRYGQDGRQGAPRRDRALILHCKGTRVSDCAGEDRRRRGPGGDTVGLAGQQILLAEALALQGDVRGAAANARQALTADDSDGVQIPAATFFLAGRATAEATKIGETLANRLLTPRALAYARLITGQIALAQGRKTDAVEEFRQGIKLADLWLLRFNLGRAFLEAGAFAEALAEFDACTKRRGEATAVFLDDVPSIRYLASVPYWAGRSQEGLGLVTQAQENYRRFLSIRTKDSPDPPVKAARRRLGEK